MTRDFIDDKGMPDDQSGLAANCGGAVLAADALLAARLWASAYYIAGYAIEGGLKSCILARVQRAPEVLFQEGGSKFSTRCWSHDLERLMGVAGIEDDLKIDIRANSTLGVNWGIVSNWNEGSRYQTKTQVEAEELYKAITDKSDGVMQWIRARW